MNHLEQLVGEWYEYSGYFVRRNVLVGKRLKGGYECELDVVAFNPRIQHLVHIEPSFDADSWSKRAERFTKKFESGLFIGYHMQFLPHDLSQEEVHCPGRCGQLNRTVRCRRRSFNCSRSSGWRELA